MAALMPPPASEAIARHLSAPLSRGIAALASLVPVSASEILVVSLFVGVVIAATRRWRQSHRPRWQRPLLWGYDLSRVASLLVAAFYLLWGIGYSAPPLRDRLQLASLVPEATADSLHALTRLAVEESNRAYQELHGSRDAGRPTAGDGHGELKAELRRGLDLWTSRLPELALAPRVRTPLKTLVSSELFHRMGISGVYSPFLAEAHVVESLPGCTLGQVTAHEMAHQRGVHREDEANFVAFLTCTSSASAALRYSGWLFAQRQGLRALARSGDPIVTELLERRLPGVQRDVDALHAYWEVARGRTGRVATRMNHAYLRSQRVADGVASYSRSLDLILRWQIDPRRHHLEDQRP